MIRKADLLKSLAVSSVLIPATGFAGGYQIFERSASDLGRAFSGGGATVDDASILATNPAGMSLLKGPQVTLALNLVSGNVESKVESSGVRIPTIGVKEASGDKDSGNVAPSNPVIPAFYASYPLNDQITLGFGAFSNFSTSTHYKKEFAASMLALDSQITTYNLNPSMSYKIDDSLSLGFGLNAVNAYAKISSANPQFGPLTDAQGNVLIDANGSPRVGPTGAALGMSEVSGSAWGYGWNLGLLYSFSTDARVSLSYRSHVSTTLEGETKFKDAQQGLGYADYDTKAPIKLPAIASISGYYAFADGFALSADVTYTQWSVFEKLETFKKSDNSLASQTIEDWRDSFRGALGITYAYDDALTLRTGVALDDSPIPNHRRTLRIPTSNMTWLSLGARYAFNPELSLDAGYSYVFMKDTKIEDERTFVGQPFTAEATAEASLALHILGLQLSYNL